MMTVREATEEWCSMLKEITRDRTPLETTVEERQIMVLVTEAMIEIRMGCDIQKTVEDLLVVWEEIGVHQVEAHMIQRMTGKLQKRHQ
ncbi:unnamed protein product [Eruca vesicaria subsp. sativa]|uniref:Uncharacterized protein n=1 Tax=Eruca vesicaria subsp. sativa TaxID=29727 RepID=A0ABC8KCM7_ERUVS|nr:unnamed protein product [Eruca vesicaria subsp. sativa]